MLLGIDFGTSNSSAALVIGNNIRLVKEPNQLGYSFPSSIYFDESEEIFIGQFAESRKFTDITRYRREFKRDLLQDYPYYLGQNGEYEFTVQELVTEVLKYFKKEAEKITFALDKGSIDSVVVTIPATYHKNKKDLMKQAVMQAGFTSAQLLEEPIAAANYYNYQNPTTFKEGNIVLVYDFGGGTFDASLIKKTGKGFRVLSQPVGKENCGGTNFDRLIFEDLKKECDDEELIKRLKVRGNSIDKDLIFDFCRNIKHQLSGISEAAGYIPINGQPYKLSSFDFNMMIDPYIEQTIVLCEDLIDSAGLKLQDIDKVLMIGGSCRIPHIQKSIESRLKASVLLIDEPELAVCQGAVIGTKTFQPGSPSIEKIISKLKPSVFFLRGTSEIGTGFLISDRGHILTCNHIVEENSVQVINSQGSSLKASVVGRDSLTDLAILKIEEIEADPLSFADPITINEGQKVYALGHPSGLNFTVSQGIVSNRDRLRNGISHIQIDVSSDPGNSGGPIINERGEVVGIASSTISRSQGLGFAIAIRHILAFAAKLRVSVKQVSAFSINNQFD